MRKSSKRLLLAAAALAGAVLVSTGSIGAYASFERRSLYRYCLENAPSLDFSKESAVGCWADEGDGGTYYFYQDGTYVVDYPEEEMTIIFTPPPQSCIYQFHRGKLAFLAVNGNEWGGNEYQSYSVEENVFFRSA